MADDREVLRILELVLAAPAAEREAILSLECAGNADLRGRVEGLLRGYEAGRVFDSPVFEVLRPGVVVGRTFTIERRLGGGGFGQVWLCRDLHGQRCAIKAPRSETLHLPDVAAAFKREVFRWIAIGDHVNVVHAIGLIDFLRMPIIVMEYVDGAVSLDALQESSTLDWRSAVAFGEQIAAGMAFAHESIGLVHNDLKPSNIIVTPDGVAMVTDFGVGVAHDIEAPSEESKLGSVRYMAPELIQTGQRDTRSDIYSLGLVLFELATGRGPFPSDSAEALMDAHVSKSPPNAHDIRPDVPRALASLIDACLAKDPAKRPDSFRTLAAELDGIRSANGIAPSPQARAIVRPNRAEAATNLATTLLAHGMADEAEAAARRAVEADAAFAPGWHALGNVLAAKKRWKEAIQAFVRVQQLDPADLIAVQNLVAAYIGIGNEREAMVWLNQALARAVTAGRVEALETLPQAVLQTNEPARALQLCDLILEKNPRAIGCLNTRAIALRRLGAYDEALGNVDAALQLNPGYVPALTNRATLLVHLERPDEAIAAADRALSIDASIANAWLARAAALRALGRSSEAVQSVRTGLTYHPEHELLRRALLNQETTKMAVNDDAWAQLQAGNNAAGREALLRACRHQSATPDLLALGTFEFFREPRRPEVVAEFVTRLPASCEAQSLMAIVSVVANRFDQAVQAFLEAKKGQPKGPHGAAITLLAGLLLSDAMIRSLFFPSDSGGAIAISPWQGALSMVLREGDPLGRFRDGSAHAAEQAAAYEKHLGKTTPESRNTVTRLIEQWSLIGQGLALRDVGQMQACREVLARVSREHAAMTRADAIDVLLA